MFAPKLVHTVSFLIINDCYHKYSYLNLHRPSPITTFTEDQALYFAFYTLFSSGSVWFSIFLAIVTATIPDFLIIVIENLKETELFKKLKHDIELTIQLSKINKSSDVISLSLSTSNESNSNYEMINMTPAESTVTSSSRRKSLSPNSVNLRKSNKINVLEGECSTIRL